MLVSLLMADTITPNSKTHLLLVFSIVTYHKMLLSSVIIHTSLCKHDNSSTVHSENEKYSTNFRLWSLRLSQGLEKNITVVFKAENSTMTVNILEDLTGFLTASKQKLTGTAHHYCGLGYSGCLA